MEKRLIAITIHLQKPSGMGCLELPYPRCAVVPAPLILLAQERSHLRKRHIQRLLPASPPLLHGFREVQHDSFGVMASEIGQGNPSIAHLMSSFAG